MLQFVKKHAVKLAAAPVAGLAAAPSFAASVVPWATVTSGVTAEATDAMTAGIGLFALFLGVSAGIKMVRKFVG